MNMIASVAPLRAALKSTVAGLLIGAAAFSAAISEAQAETLRLLSNLEINDPTIQNSLVPFIEAVKEATAGEIEIAYNGPEVVPGFEQFQPVQAGAFQLLYTHPVYFNGTTTVGVSIDATEPDPEARRSSGYFDQLDSYFGTLGMKLVAIVPTGTRGYQFVLKQPLAGEANSLQGRKIRGNATYQPVIEAFGGTVVVLPAGDVYTSLDRGVIDGAAWGASGVLDRKWQEVAGYLSRSTFGSSSNIILMNKAAFDGLTAEQQTAILEEGRKMELSTPPIINEIVDAEWAALKEAGMQETNFPPADEAQLESVFRAGIWATASQTDPALVESLRKLAVDAGISN